MPFFHTLLWTAYRSRGFSSSLEKILEHVHFCAGIQHPDRCHGVDLQFAAFKDGDCTLADIGADAI
jgi:hypothetical protein